MIVGFDTATTDTAVAVVAAGVTRHEATVGAGEDGRPAHGRTLLSLVDAAVGESGGWEEVELIAVGLGPGSFTGLRIGVSTARALAQARDLPLAGVPTTAALAEAARDHPAAAGRFGIGVVDARRGEIFAAIDRGEGTGAPVVCPPEGLAGALGGGVAGSLAAGEGAVRFRPEIEAAGVEVLDEGDPANRVAASRICLLAANIDAGDRPPVGELTPIYMRRPDAERWIERNDRT